MTTRPDVTFEDGTWIHLRLTDATCDALSRLNVFLGYHERHPTDPNKVIRIPKNARFEEYASFHGAFHTIGAFSYSETANLAVDVGRYCSIASGFLAFGARHPIERVTSSGITYCFQENHNKPQFIRAHRMLMGENYLPDFDGMQFQPAPIIAHDVWIGQNVQAARGITIGTGAVVAAGSVVTKNVPPYSIVGGNPARPIRMRFPEETATRLLGTEWWAYHPETIWKLGYTNPSEFCDKFDHAARSGEIVPHQYRQLTWRDVVDEIATAQAGLSPLQMAAEPSQLLTGHGTVVFADFEGQLHHGPLALSPANVLLAGDRQAAYLMHRGSDGVQRPMEVSPSAEFRQAYDIPSDGNARPGEFGVVGAQGSVFGLTRNGLFLCAELDGRITLSRRLLAQWERFDLLRCDDLPSPGGKGHATK